MVRKLPKHIIRTVGFLKFPDPCIRMRAGSGKALLNNFLDPFTPFNIETSTFRKKNKLSEFKKLRKNKMKTVCLF